MHPLDSIIRGIAIDGKALSVRKHPAVHAVRFRLTCQDWYVDHLVEYDKFLRSGLPNGLTVYTLESLNDRIDALSDFVYEAE